VIEDLEAQWVDIEERLPQVEQLGELAMNAAMAERDELAAKLENAHAARDAAVRALLAHTERIGAMSVSVPEAKALEMPAPAKSSWRKQHSRRAWWRFGR
jgi:hypothetical protein